MPESRAAKTVIKLCSAIVVGSIPFSNIVSRLAVGKDLREVGTGTVSPTNVYRIAGTPPFAVACLLEFSKGAICAMLTRRSQPGLAAAVGGLIVVGHNWSPFLRGAGGRGVLPATGFLLVTAPPGAALFGGAVAVGYVCGDT